MVWWDYGWHVGDVEGEISTIDLLYTVTSLLARALERFAGFSEAAGIGIHFRKTARIKFETTNHGYADDHSEC